MTQNLFGKLFADKSYIFQALFQTLFERGLELITALRKNMKGQLMLLSDRLLLRKRFIIETINDQLKNISQVEHTRVLDKTAPPGPVRHRSPANFAINLLAALIAYTHQPKKPSLRMPAEPEQLCTFNAPKCSRCPLAPDCDYSNFRSN